MKQPVLRMTLPLEVLPPDTHLLLILRVPSQPSRPSPMRCTGSRWKGAHTPLEGGELLGRRSAIQATPPRDGPGPPVAWEARGYLLLALHPPAFPPGQGQSPQSVPQCRLPALPARIRSKAPVVVEG